MALPKRGRGLEVTAKRTEVQMSIETIELEREIKIKTGMSIRFLREKTLKDAYVKMHKRMFKPDQVLTNLRSNINE